MPPRRQWFKEVARAVRSSVVLLSRPLRLVDAVLCCILDVAGLGRQPRLGVVQLVGARRVLARQVLVHPGEHGQRSDAEAAGGDEPGRHERQRDGGRHQHRHRPAEGRGRRGLERRHHGALLLLLLRLAVHAAPALEVAVAPATSRRTPVVISHGRLAERARYPTCARCPELLPLMLELRLRVR
uniref:Uncharacterized protein n=1 Tax=Zea mays TaxID=4577 RepID=A0A804MCD2_MAIZE